MLPHTEISKKIQNIPKFELSYENSTSHSKVLSDPNYQIMIAIPRSKTYIAWFTFIGDEDVCILLELNREKKIVAFQQLNVVFDTKMPHLAVGTFFYGSFLPPDSNDTKSYSTFIIEDVLLYKGMSLRKLPFGDRLGILHHIMITEPDILPQNNGSECHFHLPLIYDSSNTPSQALLTTPYYKIHHFQYRSLTHVIPYLNVPANQPTTSKTLFKSEVQPIPNLVPPIFSAKYKQPVPNQIYNFLVSADIQSDIYNLIDPIQQYKPDFAYIPNYRISVFMNQIFRNIKENINIDKVEESDDEEDFYDTRLDKYVDLSKQVLMKCTYHKKFRRWVPLKVCI